MLSKRRRTEGIEKSLHVHGENAGLSHIQMPPPLTCGRRGAGFPPQSKMACLSVRTGRGLCSPKAHTHLFSADSLTCSANSATLSPLLGPVFPCLPWHSWPMCLLLAKVEATPENSVSKCLLTPPLPDDTRDPLPGFSQTLSCQDLWQVNLYSPSQGRNLCLSKHSVFLSLGFHLFHQILLEG